MHPDPSTCYEALVTRDRRFEGRFVLGVTTTGVYCRPGCPARTPKRENVRFFPGPAAAEASGFRACLRCRPDRGVDASAWGKKSSTVAHALRLLEGADAPESMEALALRAGVSARQLRRLFEQELGLAPRELVRARRLRFARELLEQTTLPISRIAFQAGFRSLRRFNDAVRSAFGKAPSRLRGARAAGAEIVLRLPYRPPLAWEALLSFLARRAIPGLEEVCGDTYRRRLPVGSLEVSPVANESCLRLRLDGPHTLALLPLVARVRRLFDLDADAQAIDGHLERDAVLAPLVRKRPGVRVLGAFEPFEVLVRTVLGQQISVPAARTLAGRLFARVGLEPQALAAADLRAIGLPTARAQALSGVAGLVAAGQLDLLRELPALPGIGAWTREYYAMRALGDCDAFPARDLVLRHHEARAERWRPWRAYAAMHLWLEP